MPRDLELRLKRRARKLRLGRRRTKAYVFGTLAKIKRRMREKWTR